MRKVLIIKTGLHETFAPIPEQVGVSLGDVLRSTSLLHLFLEDEVDWLTSANARGLLHNNSLITNLFTSYTDLVIEDYDLILNFEHDFSVLDNSLNKVVGFTNRSTFQSILGQKYSLEEFSQLSNEFGLLTWQEKLFFLMGEKFTNQDYVLGMENSKKEFDIGLNWKAGPKWPSKAMDKKNWEFLYEELSKKKSVSWQEGFDNLEQYANWISRCKVLISNDSLGMHIAFALKVPCFSLFGPTKAEEIYFYHQSKPWFFPVPDDYDCMGCLKTHCPLDKACVEFFNKDQFLKDFENWLGTLSGDYVFGDFA